MRTMHPHRRNWPMIVLTLALLATVAAIFLGYAAPAIQDLHGALSG